MFASKSSSHFFNFMSQCFYFFHAIRLYYDIPIYDFSELTPAFISPGFILSFKVVLFLLVGVLLWIGLSSYISQVSTFDVLTSIDSFYTGPHSRGGVAYGVTSLQAIRNTVTKASRRGVATSTVLTTVAYCLLISLVGSATLHAASSGGTGVGPIDVESCSLALEPLRSLLSVIDGVFRTSACFSLQLCSSLSSLLTFSFKLFISLILRSPLGFILTNSCKVLSLKDVLQSFLHVPALFRGANHQV
jgi:hypothetical protein